MRIRVSRADESYENANAAAESLPTLYTYVNETNPILLYHIKL